MKKKSGLVFVEMLPGCRVARFPGGDAPPLTTPAHVPFAADASLPARFLLDVLSGRKHFPQVEFDAFLCKKKALLFCCSFYQRNSVLSFRLMASAAPCVPRHLFPGESFQTLSYYLWVEFSSYLK